MQIDFTKLPNLPDFTERIIYSWDDERGKNARAFILIGYCPDTLDYHLAMYLDALKTFPNLKLSDITVGKVSKSRWCYGFTLLTFSIKNPKNKYKGWRVDHGSYNYDIGY